MDPTDCSHAGQSATAQADSLFDRCSWFYGLCREHLFRDHTAEISQSLFPAGPACGTHILELGCGPGFYACQLARLYPQITATGLDLSTRLIERARTRAASRSLSNCRFRQGDAQSLPELPGPIDAVIISRLFLIVPKKQAVLSEAFRVLRPGGCCFIAEPTSGFRTRIPLNCMRLLARCSSRPATEYREPRHADVMSRADFIALVQSQPWASVEFAYDWWYQYAVCTKARVATDSQPPAISLQPDLSAA